RIIALRAVREGEACGYNSRWTARSDRPLATLSIGYADCLPRNSGGVADWPGGAALSEGACCPFLGSAPTDPLTTDVTDAPPGAARRGAAATIIGGALDLEAVGAAGRTIGYEILTSLGKRFQRRYIGG